MIVRVLGCAGSLAPGSHTSAFLVDDDLLLDAGSGVGRLDLAQMSRIDHVLLTHGHLDHVLALPLLADSVMRRRQGRPPIHVHALPETLAVLRQHLFNNQLWPDFTRLPRPEHPTLHLQPVHPGQVLHLGRRGRAVTVLPARHSVPAIGFAVRGPGRAHWVYTGDTGPNPALWAALRPLQVSHLAIELAFPEREQALAHRSLHHCPSSLAAELRHAPAGAEILVTHLKPGEWAGIRADLSRRLPHLKWRALRQGQRFTLG